MRGPEPPAPSHRAPAEEAWRPLSGLAVLALLLSVVGVMGCLLYWWVQVIPAALGLLTLARVNPTRRRGRALGAWALGIALVTGATFFYMTQQTRRHLVGLAEHVLGILASEADLEHKRQALHPWLDPSMRESDLVTRVDKRFQVVQERFGPYEPPPTAGSVFSGMYSLVVPTQPLEEVGTKSPGPLPPPGSAVWVKARFGGHDLRVAFALGTEDVSPRAHLVLKDRRPGEAAPVVGDIRFFRTGPRDGRRSPTPAGPTH